MMSTGEVLTPISPSFVSTELLTPHQKDRITISIPSIGYHSVQRRPIGCKTWGTNLTDYGGIGKLPFLGKTRARDLYVTRSLKHFGSGFSQYKAVVQPYQLTSLMKSACRVNDQTVPSSFQIELDPRKYKLDMYDDVKNRNPYLSHQCIFEVFPYHDPNRAYLPGNVLMTDRTRQDQLKKYTDVYSTHSYNDCYPDHSDVMRERAKRLPSCDCDIKNQPTNQSCPQGCVEKDIKNSPHRGYGQVYENDSEYNGNDGSQQVSTDPEDCVCDREPQLSADVVVDMSPLCYILSQLGPDLNVFSGTDALTLVLEYYGCSAVDVIVNRIRESAADNNSLLLLTRALGDFSGFVLGKIFPLVRGGDMQGASVYDVIMGKIKEPDMKPKEEKKQPVDAHKQYPTLRSVIIGTNATSFDHALMKEKDPNVIKGIAPVWPPSGCYVLNKQRMKLESFDSFPKNYCANPLPAIQPQGDTGERSPTPPYEGKEKKVHFSDTILSFEYDPEKRDEEEGDAVPGTSPSGLRWYKKYMDSILPHPTTSPPPPSQPRLPAAGGYEPSFQTRHEVAVPPILCRYPPAPPSVTRGDWRTRSIVDPNQHLKTLAQRRYHLLHPDPVPDLRENHTFSKKYFFSGYHTSTFRG